MAAADLVQEVRTALRAASDPERGRGMQAYLKTAEPCLGVRLPEVRRIVRAAAAMHPADVGRAAGQLWREASARDERHAAIALTGLPVARRDLLLLPLYEEMVTTGAWWDLVDGVQPRVRDLLLAHPARLRPVLQGWARSPDRWLRRSAVIAQLGAKERTDTALLAEVIEVNAADPEFFVRKGIGWALREHTKTDPDWVRRFLAEHELSPLSRRQAAKHLDSSAG
ncbi:MULTISPECIES: DNA alkylation repair protein [unclassified Modestobacter]|uniref:DNA alkylation repair protein n=1 Tax=unclassified Modestobacter TaxID=2643866 RepID=UPI0022AAA3D8|nr:MULTISPECIES: DNA alkylation repair protein [unclassified Modestobacter]MCZ2824180.1 DNA alkylation repair protein [Modestobacter sp. VKM Ac-2981]MCZ2854292.1 DNA alkylation repair protein [Modestobacter sp. VKM Ac-2982]